MRLDKFLTSTGNASRSEAAKAARRGEIRVNGVAVTKADTKIDPETDTIEYKGKRIIYRKKIFIMLNKPQGYVSSTDGKDGETVVSLLPEELQKCGIFPCGRLDKDTLGLMILTNDGETAHYLLSPKRHVSKMYYVRTEKVVSASDVSALENGISLDHGDRAKPAKVELLDSRSLYVTITEGMYHQIKRMLEAVDNKVVYLERVEFATLPLDSSLGRGEWRFLTESETEILLSQTK